MVIVCRASRYSQVQICTIKSLVRRAMCSMRLTTSRYLLSADWRSWGLVHPDDVIAVIAAKSAISLLENYLARVDLGMLAY